MYQHCIREQLELLVKNKLLKSDDLPTAEAILIADYWTDRIALIWSVDDITEHARNRGDGEISHADTVDILHTLHDEYNAEYGIGWDSISSELDNRKANQ